jgi:hypothetical protein
LSVTVKTAPALAQQQAGGPQRGERMPSHQTRTAEEAARDLSDQRRAEAHAQEALAAHHLKKQLDADRINQALIEDDRLNREILDLAESANQTAEAQPVAQPDQFQPQPESPAVPEGADPELVKVFQNPKIRDGVMHALNLVESQRQQYAQATQSALQNAALAEVAAIPELHGMSGDQAKGALAVIAKNNPARYLEIVGHMQNFERIRQTVHQQAAAQQQQHQAEQQRVAQQTQTWMEQQDDAFEKWAQSRPADEVKAVRGGAIDMLVNHYGMDRNELAQLWGSNPLMRSLPVQKLLYDLTRFHMAKESIRPIQKNIPPVMRPGTAGDFTDYNPGLTEKMRAFAANPTAKSGAAALMARRQAAARRR